MPDQRLKVLIADDHPMMLVGLSKLLATDCDVVGMASDGRALLQVAERTRPDLVITDISMPELDGIEATRRLRASVPGVRVLILSIHTDPSWVQAAFEAGACGYLTKTSVLEEIELAVREVSKGRYFVSPSVTKALLATVLQAAAGRRKSAPPPGAGACEPLTPREVEIVRLVGLGLANKEIARRLGVSVTTVRTHLSKIYGKLGTPSRVELALLAAAHADSNVM
jgi:DNA-binding NarL/FixJ family response regulator